jgi:hypothetical protein
MNGLNLRCTTLCLPSSIQALALRLGCRLPVSLAPRLTTIMVTTMMIMVVLDMPIIVVGDISMRPRASARRFDLAEYRARWGPKGSTVVSASQPDGTRLVQETGGRVGETKRIALGWLKMVVLAKRAAVPVLRWRLMAPKSGFVVGHGALT